MYMYFNQKNLIIEYTKIDKTTFADVPLRDDLLVEVWDESAGHLPVRRLVVHGQLDQDGDNHPTTSSKVGKHLL